MAYNSHKYYLQVDGWRVIDFSKLKGFPDMSNFLTLSLFTGLFRNEDELLAALDNLGLISLQGDESVSIVKKMGNAKTGYNFKYVTCDIMYKSATYLMSPSSIESFLSDNRSRSDVMMSFFEKYAVDLDQLINYFEIKIQRLERMLEVSAIGDKKSVAEELDSKRNSLKNFRYYKSNIMEILSIVNYMSQSHYQFERDMELEFISRVRTFVESEVHYIREKKRTPNYRGLIKLALRIEDLLIEFPNLNFPYSGFNFSREKQMLLKCYKAALLEVSKGPSLPDDEVNNDDSCRENRVSASSDFSSESDEPDRFMFLEIEDFEKLLTLTDDDDTKLSIEFDIANLKEQQGKFGKL